MQIKSNQINTIKILNIKIILYFYIMKITPLSYSKKTKKIPVKYITLCLSIVGVIILYTLSLSQQPIILNSIESIEEYNGKEVTLTGKIKDHTTTNYGNQIITIQCNSTELTIFSETPLQIHNGDTLQATGTIQKYKDTWELIVSNPQAATIVSTWQNKTTDIKDLAQHPKNYLNIPLNLTGYIDSTYDSLLYLNDATGNYTIPLIAPTNTIPETGSHVYFQATLTYDPSHLRYILKECTTIKPIQQNTEDKLP